MSTVVNRVFVVESSYEPETGQGIYTERVIAELSVPFKRIVLNGGYKSGLGRILYSFAMIFYLAVAISENDRVYWLMSRSPAALYRETILALLLRRHGTRVVVHLHGNELDKTIKKIPYWFRIRLIESMQKLAVIVLCDCVAKRVSAEGINKNLHVIGNTIENKWEAMPVKFQAVLPDSHVRLLYLSNLLPEKGILSAIDALGTLNACQYLGRTWSLDIAGGWSGVSGQDRALILERMSKIEAINYHGFVNNDTKRQLFAEANLFLFPSRYQTEAFPLSVLEALISAVPILTTSVGCIPEMVTGCPHVELLDVNESLDKKIMSFSKRLANRTVVVDTRPAFRMVGEEGPKAICKLIECVNK